MAGKVVQILKAIEGSRKYRFSLAAIHIVVCAVCKVDEQLRS